MNKDLTIKNLLLKLKFFEDECIVKDVNKQLFNDKNKNLNVL